MKKVKATVIGNGTSRAGISLESLDGVVFGCNALYRVYEPDYLVAIDTAIVNEIRASDFPKEKFIEPPEDEKWEPVELHWKASNGPFWKPQRPRSNAGMNAILEAIKMGFNDLYMYGYDFLIVDDAQATSNMFEGTSCYGPETRANINDTRNRFNYLFYILQKNPTVNFTFLFPDEMRIYHPDMNNCFIQFYK